jgi:hypothetical protein
MNVERDLEFERVSQAWLAEGPTELADRVLAAALADVHRSHQRRTVFGVPWRFPPVNSIPRLLVAAAVIAVIGVGGLALLLRPASGPAAPSQSAPAVAPSPSALRSSSSAASSPSVTPSAIALTTFTSSLLGYSVGLPDGWTQADAPEGLPEELYPGPDSKLAERFTATGGSPWLVVSSPPVGGDLTPEQWLARSREISTENGCRVLGSEPRTVDGIAVDQDIFACSNEIVLVAAVVRGDRIHQIAFGYLAGNDAASRELYRQMLASFAFTN